MEEKDKPEQTNPSNNDTSVDSTSAGTDANASPEDTTRERVKNIIQSQKESDQNVSKEGSEQKTPEQGGGLDTDVSSEEDSSKTEKVDLQKEALKLLSEMSGREYNNIDDAKKHISNLNSLVGDQAIAQAREDSKLYREFLNKWSESKDEDIDTSKKFWENFLSGVDKIKPEVEKSISNQETDKEKRLTDERIDKLEDANQRLELRNKYSYSSEVEDEIAIIAQNKGISYVKAFEESPFKELFESKAKEESKKNPTVTPSNRTGFDVKEIQKLGAKVISQGQEEDEIKLVEKYLNL